MLLCVKLNNGFHMLTATCHCKNVRLDIKMKTLQKIEKCNCSMCSRKFAAYFFVDVDKLSLANGQDSLAEYNFHSKQARHFFCRICGVHTHHLMRVDPTKYAVNLACLTDVKIEDYSEIKYWNGRDHPKDNF